MSCCHSTCTHLQCKRFPLFQLELGLPNQCRRLICSNCKKSRISAAVLGTKLIYQSTPTNQLRFHGCQRAAHGTRKILLVGKDQQGCTCQALFLQKSFLSAANCCQRKKHRLFPIIFLHLESSSQRKSAKTHHFNWT